jgi:hypothetical protein
MNALSALGLAYDSESEDGDDDEGHAVTNSALPVAVAEKPPPVQPSSSSGLLPDASGLLKDLPDEVDWDARNDSDDEEPQYDKKGTRYNNVALPQALQNEQTSFNATTGPRAGGSWKSGGASAAAAVAAGLAAVDAAVAGSSATASGGGGGGGGGGAGAKSCGSGSSSGGGGSGAAPPRRALPKATGTGGGGMLLPPQIRGRSNVTTEELSSMRTTKRHKS